VQLVVRGVRLDKGLGARHLEFEALKEKLAVEGLFAPERKRALPRYPRSIGIVTSPDGAALRDVLRIVGSYPVRIIISPALVQGDGASASISLALRALQGRTDLVIVCRGGGSAEDLWCFNSETVARSIAECDCPVISAVGHETDVTIADFVADVRAPTPTAAARMAVPDTTELTADLVDLERRMVRALWSGLERKQERLQYLERGISLRRMIGLLEEASQRLDYLGERLGQAEQKRIESCRQRLENASNRLGSVSPLATLSRGYSLVRSERGLVRVAEDVDPGETVEITLADGRLWARVLEKSD
jgi:exodeoxyribonuclease VII large subunit